MDYQLVTPHYLKRAAKLYVDKVGFVSDDREYTYGELYERMQRLSYGLISLGIKEGVRVAYFATNTLEMYEGFYGVGQTGAIHLPLNSRLTGENFKYILTHSGASAIYVDKQFLETILEIKDDLPELKIIISNEVPAGVEGVHDYEQLLASSSAEPFDYSHLKEDDVASLLYASCKTGASYGVLL